MGLRETECEGDEWVQQSEQDPRKGFCEYGNKTYWSLEASNF
jgi:hypothetical protein